MTTIVMNKRTFEVKENVVLATHKIAKENIFKRHATSHDGLTWYQFWDIDNPKRSVASSKAKAAVFMRESVSVPIAKAKQYADAGWYNIGYYNDDGSYCVKSKEPTLATFARLPVVYAIRMTADEELRFSEVGIELANLKEMASFLKSEAGKEFVAGQKSKTLQEAVTESPVIVSVDALEQIKALRKEGLSIRDIAAKMGLSKSDVGRKVQQLVAV